MTIRDLLRGVTAYPIPEETLDGILFQRGGGDPQSLGGTALSLAKADLYRWLATAPDVSQGGQSYSLSSDVRAYYRQQANKLYLEGGEPKSIQIERGTYGHKGERL